MAQCTLAGYLSVELDIVVIVKSTVRNPSDLQLESCVREAEKLASLVRRQSPRVASELSLSALTAATLAHTVEQTSGVTVNCMISNFLITVLLLVRYL